MGREKKSSLKLRTRLLFYSLAFYIIAQFGWWTYLLIDLNQSYYHQKKELVDLDYLQPVQNLEKELHLKTTMILGEGSVFLVLLIIGFYVTQKSIRRELSLLQQQRNFLLSVTHELKSPIASAKLYLQTLEKRNLDPESQKSIISKAIKDTDRLNSLVENLLLATRIDNSSYPIYLERINISDLTSEILNDLVKTYGNSHLTSTQIEPNQFAFIDESAFRSILSNLYENAVKYSPTGTKINVALQRDEDQLLLKIEDEGPGIAPEYRKVIFDKFYRLGDEDTRKTKGTGLGLYIVREFVRLHKGTISVTCPVDKPGTQFLVRFPKS